MICDAFLEENVCNCKRLWKIFQQMFRNILWETLCRGFGVLSRGFGVLSRGFGVLSRGLGI